MMNNTQSSLAKKSLILLCCALVLGFRYTINQNSSSLSQKGKFHRNLNKGGLDDFVQDVIKPFCDIFDKMFLDNPKANEKVTQGASTDNPKANGKVTHGASTDDDIELCQDRCHPTPSPTRRPTPAPSLRPTQSPSFTPSLTQSESPSLTQSESPSLTQSESPSLTQSPSFAPSLSHSPSLTQSPSLSPSLSLQPTILVEMNHDFQWKILTNETDRVFENKDQIAQSFKTSLSHLLRCKSDALIKDVKLVTPQGQENPFLKVVCFGYRESCTINLTKDECSDNSLIDEFVVQRVVIEDLFISFVFRSGDSVVIIISDLS